MCAGLDWVEVVGLHGQHVPERFFGRRTLSATGVNTV